MYVPQKQTGSSCRQLPVRCSQGAIIGTVRTDYGGTLWCRKATQLLFCDLSTPKNDGTFNVYDNIREKLIARGIPAEQERIIHEETTDAQKKELFGKIRSGEVRVLLGSTYQ